MAFDNTLLCAESTRKAGILTAYDPVAAWLVVSLEEKEKGSAPNHYTVSFDDPSIRTA